MITRSIRVLFASALFAAFASSANAQWFQVANYNTSSSPDQPSSIYLGDQSLTFGCNSWGVLLNQWGGIRVYIHTSSDIHNGTAGGAITYSSSSSRENTSAQFTSTGTWYWGVRMQYNSGGTIVGWYCRNRSFWSDAWGTPVSDLTLTVQPLNAPTSQSATSAGASQINLTWSRGVSGGVKDTLVVRSTSSNFTAPTQGSSYSSGNTIGSGTVIYKGNATSLSSSGLNSGTTYYYAFYAENYSYYSAAATASATTDIVAPTTQASSISVNNERQTQMGVSWTSGNGTRRIVVARASAAPTGTPSDGTDYSATYNNNFGSAPALGDGVVVYDGTGNSFTLTGLSADTTYYLRAFEYNGTGANTKYYTSTATGNPGSGQTLGAPTGVSAAPNSGSNPATRLDLAWTKNNGKDVMVVRSTSSNFTAPTQGSSYSTGAALGSGTVVYKGSGTATSISGLTPGTTYYFAFYSENFSYYSTAATANTDTWMPRARNTSGSASPGSPAGTLWVGDNGTFTAEAWGTIEGNWSRAKMWLSADANLGGADASTAYTSYQNTDPRSITSPRYFQAGTLYWGLQVEYGTPTYGENFWYKDSSASWTQMSADGNGATLTITVTALTAPSGQSATPTSSSQINLAWTKGVSGTAKDTLVVRSTSSTFTAPTAGSAYSSGNSLGSGTVIYKGSGTSLSDTGLSAGTTYYYAFYAENNSYYSASVTEDATTDALAPPSAPTAIAATSVGNTSFFANWNSAATATGYRLDVSSDPTFSGEWVAQDVDVGNVTTYQITSLPVGQYFYRVRAYNAGGTSGNSNMITVNLDTANGRNKNGGTPYYTPATIYVGDNATFGVDTWGDLNDNWAQGRVVIDTDSNIISGGIRGTYAAFDNVEYTEATSPRFTSAGTWYWGIQMNYGTPYGTNFWMVRDNASWTALQYKGTNGNLTVTVLALGDPTSVSATQDGGSPQSQINLAWTRWNSRDVMVVRSTTSTFTTPTAGSAYNSGNTIGSGTVVYRGSATSVSDTGLNSGQTYYYRFYSENFSYYSAGTDANANTTPGCVNGSAPTMAHPGNQVVYANNSAQVSFNITANDSSGCTAPTFTYSDLPSGASFNSTPSGNSRTGSFSWTPQTSQIGTYPIRFTATDSENLTTSLIVKVIVGDGSPQEGNTGGVPNSQYNWTVAITNIQVDMSGNAVVVYQSTNGMAYDIYQSDSAFGNSMSWTKVDDQNVASGATDSSAQNYSGTRRFFQVVPAGATPSTNGVWGVIRPTVATGWNLLSPPLVSDLSFAGAFGSNLAVGLTGAGIETSADQVHALDGSGNPYVLWLNSNDNNRWYEGGSPASRSLNPGQGFMIYRQGGSSTLPLIGSVGNKGTNSFAIKNGQWNMLGFSQGKNLSGNPLPGSLSGSPVASYSYSSADILTVLNANGTWKNYQRYGNNTWLDLQTLNMTTTISMQPGQGFYYYRQPGSDLTVGF